MKLWVAPESNKTLTGVLLIENVPVSTEAPAGWDVTHCSEVQLASAHLHHRFLSRSGRLASCTLILRVGLHLPGLGTLINVVPWLATVVATTISNIARRCIRLWSLLLGIAELEVPCGLALRLLHHPASS
jgi:hypothetical protein